MSLMDKFTAASGMDSFVYFVLLLALPLLLLIKLKKKSNLPPGPRRWPIVGNLVQVMLSKLGFQGYIQKVQRKYGPIFTIRLGSQPMIIIASRDLAHEALVQKGSLFASRPPAKGLRKLFTSNQMNISSAPYGPLWRSLRRNLVSETLSSPALKSFQEGRDWGLQVLIQGLKTEAAQNEGVVKLVEHLRHASFCLLLYMCFGLQVEENEVREVEGVMRELLLTVASLALEDTFPILKVFYRKRRERMQGMHRRQEEKLVSLINRRREELAEGAAVNCRAYVDSLFSLTVDGGRCLTEQEMATLCSEFITGGTDTTSTTIQWVMANLVKYPDVQSKLYKEIVGVVGKEGVKLVEEEKLVSEMQYLEAVVKEALRRHPPAKFVLSHAVTEDCSLGGYDIPVGAFVNFCVSEMGNDPAEWENPADFRPERFVNGEVDLTGGKGIKMMPFGVGRRICPGLAVAMLHVELIVATLVLKFEWQTKPGETVDLAETQEFTTVMKYPLQAVIKERVATPGY
ncbi:hypothetical protein SUGI_0827440 [Cryptomeria japonica]|uniref:cytochrome P450 77A3 n=1 Tax=Cryptomeria japonica TaxID=3369 RepID=UPI002414B652|nr:cytochrome P450 77A3 [Cryptomeria japonica]GLJ40276.1 hypothetical protein SUGI_0827440 [Cryptomeria japonica]